MTSGGDTTEVEIAIIGAGFSGIGMAIRLQQAGFDDYVVLERGDELGGTWRDNTYPGCQCDVPSHLYSLSFALNPDWSRTYSHQAEIWDYLRETAERFGVSERIRFGHEVLVSSWDDAAGLWRLQTTAGEITARSLISAPGALAEPSLPAIPGIERFRGASFHSAQWDHDHDLRGERVAVIGTGASAIQFAPEIAPDVGRMLVFQRTPPWVLPQRDRPIRELERRLYRRFPSLQRLVRGLTYAIREVVVPGFAFDHRLNRPVRHLAESHMRSQIDDPELRRRLTPDYTIGCKRILPSNRWYPMLQRENVELIDHGIAEVRERSIVAADGSEHEVDTIIYGTGFQVLEMPAAERVRGRDGRTLAEHWAGSAQAYMGTTVAGFPNMYMLLGPNTGLGTNSVVFMAEAQMAHVVSCLEQMREDGAGRCEVRASAQQKFNRAIQRRSANSVWTAGGCSSWYLDPEGRNRAIWPSFSWRFWQLARRMRRRDYVLSRGPVDAPAAGGAGAPSGEGAGAGSGAGERVAATRPAKVRT